MEKGFQEKIKMSYNISSTHILKLLSEGDLFRAILETAATLEEIFFARLIHNKNIPVVLISNWSLGKLLGASKDLGMIIEEEKFYPLLKDFLTLRNQCVHSGEYLIINLKDSKKEGIKGLIRGLAEFIPKNVIQEDLKNPNEEVFNHYLKEAEKKLDFLGKFS